MTDPLTDFEKALARLNESLQEPKSSITRDSGIKRFELCFELAWKAVKSAAKAEGLDCNSPKACFQTAYQLKLIADESVWLDILDDRNEAIHTYKEALADEIYSHLDKYSGAFAALIAALKTRQSGIITKPII